MVDLSHSANLQPALGVRLSRDFFNAIKSQIALSRSCTRLQLRQEGAVRDIENKLTPIRTKRVALTKSRKELSQTMKKRKITEKEKSEGNKLMGACEEAEREFQELVAEEKKLLQVVSGRRATWQTHAENVEKNLEDVLVKCGLSVAEADEKDTPPPSPKDGNVTESETHDLQVQIKLNVRKARKAVNDIQIKHDDHRKYFRRMLNAFVSNVSYIASDESDASRAVKTRFGR
jgi:hypothetical protein